MYWIRIKMDVLLLMNYLNLLEEKTMTMIAKKFSISLIRMEMKRLVFQSFLRLFKNMLIYVNRLNIDYL
mgnify:CR=1 FL=1